MMQTGFGFWLRLLPHVVPGAQGDVDPHAEGINEHRMYETAELKFFLQERLPKKRVQSCAANMKLRRLK